MAIFRDKLHVLRVSKHTSFDACVDSNCATARFTSFTSPVGKLSLRPAALASNDAGIVDLAQATESHILILEIRTNGGAGAGH